MKKILVFLAAASVIWGSLAYAEPIDGVNTTNSVAENNAQTSTSVDFDIVLSKYDYVVPSDLKLELFDADNNLTSTFQSKIYGDTDSVHAHFDVPQYIFGKTFELKLISGLTSLKYYDTILYEGDSVTVETYGYLNQDGEYVRGDSFSAEGTPHFEKKLNVYVDDRLLELSPRARLVDGSTLIPVRQIGDALGLKIYYDKEYDSVVCSYGKNEIIFNVGTTYCTIFGETAYAPTAPCYIDGSIYVPVRILAESVKSSVTVFDGGDYMDIILGASPLVEEFRNSTPVNREGIDSRTDYLIWVDKTAFKTRVYMGSQYNWELIKEFDCAIGAEESETVTGEYEYIERISSWDYDTYYVGPVMRFFNGYALHSTLLNYGGGEYDGTVGAKVSHGCVRLHPEDMNWLCAYVPLKTRVYVTEE